MSPPRAPRSGRECLLGESNLIKEEYWAPSSFCLSQFSQDCVSLLVIITHCGLRKKLLDLDLLPTHSMSQIEATEGGSGDLLVWELPMEKSHSLIHSEACPEL